MHLLKNLAYTLIQKFPMPTPREKYPLMEALRTPTITKTASERGGGGWGAGGGGGGGGTPTVPDRCKEGRKLNLHLLDQVDIDSSCFVLALDLNKNKYKQTQTVSQKTNSKK